MTRINVVLLSFILMVCTVSARSDNRKISEMGRYPFALVSTDISAREMGVKLSQRYDQDLIKGFALAGYPELANPFLVELNSGRHGEKDLATGTVFSWMLFRSNGKIKLVNNLEWAGNESLPVYTYTVRHADKEYEFVVPKPCGNVALVSVKDVVNGSNDALVKPEADSVGEQPVAAVLPAPLPENIQAQPQVLNAVDSSEKPRHLFFLVEGGPGLVRGTYTTVLWARLGLVLELVPESLDFILSFGGGTSFRAEPHKAFLMGNALMSYHMQSLYLAGGLGFSTRERTNRKGGIDLVAEVGYDLFKQDDVTGSLFFEFRTPVITSDRLFDQHYKMLLGLRLIF